MENTCQGVEEQVSQKEQQMLELENRFNDLEEESRRALQEKQEQVDSLEHRIKTLSHSLDSTVRSPLRLRRSRCTAEKSASGNEDGIGGASLETVRSLFSLLYEISAKERGRVSLFLSICISISRRFCSNKAMLSRRCEHNFVPEAPLLIIEQL